MEAWIEALRTANEGIGAELTSRSEQIESMITKLNDASSSAFDTLRQSYGGIEGSMNEGFSKLEGQSTVAHAQVQNLDARVKDIGSVQRPGSGGGFGSAGGGGGRLGTQESRESNLISIKDIKLPLLGDSNPTAARLFAVGGGIWPNKVRDAKLIGEGPGRCSV